MPPTMEFNLTPVNPNGRPRDEVRITSICALPYGDGRRIHLHVVLTPFQERPTLHVQVFGPSGRVAGSLSVIESDAHDIELTVHVRGEIEPGLHRVQAVLQFGEDPPQDTAETALEIAPPSSYY
jgi:hypothetical protein